MQFRHAISGRALKEQHNNRIAVQFTRFKRFLYRILIVKNPRWRFNHAVRLLNGRDFDNGATQIAVNQANTALGVKRGGAIGQNFAIAALRRAVAPDKPAVLQHRFLPIGAEALAENRADIIMQ